METRDDIVMVLVTAADKTQADALVHQMLTKRLAACVNTTGAHSRYIWKGAIEQAEEILLFIKTRRSLLPQLEACVCGAHSYDVPELIVLPVIAGHQPYLDWVVESTS